MIHNHAISFNNTIGQCKEDGDSMHFVDEGTVTYSHKEPAEITKVLTKHYTTIARYMAANKFVINNNKMMVMAPRRLADRGKEVSIQAGEFNITPSKN